MSAVPPKAVPPKARPRPATRRVVAAVPLRERLQASLPVLLMAALAAATWWLDRHKPTVDEARPAVAKRHEVDYDMHSFTTRRYVADGSLRTVVVGSEMRRYADDGSIEIDDVRLHAVDDDGRHYAGEARLGTADADLRVVQLKGQARVRRDAAPASAPAARDSGPMQLAGEQLWMDTKDQRVRSDHPVTLLSDTGRMDAGTLDYDGRSGQTALGKRVHGTYVSEHPAAAPSAGGKR